jgi:hypothetical protein
MSTLHRVELREGDVVYSLSKKLWQCVGKDVNMDTVSANQRDFLWYNPKDIAKRLKAKRSM